MRAGRTSTVPGVDGLDDLLCLQAGVISRRQARARGLSDVAIARKVRRRDWVILHEGVYVNHTGQPSWLQRAWAAVLFSWPAALSHQSAMRAADGPGLRDADSSTIHVVVARERHLVAPDGSGCIVGRASPSTSGGTRARRGPGYEEAALDVASTARDELTCVAAGTASVLEVGFLRRVERAHALPRARRQEAAPGRVSRIYRDASYDHDLEVELDGRLFHDTAEARDRDYDRDLVTLVSGKVTARLSWGQVFGRPCWTAGQIERLLQGRGWIGRARLCGRGCRLRG